EELPRLEKPMETADRLAKLAALRRTSFSAATSEHPDTQQELRNDDQHGHRYDGVKNRVAATSYSTEGSGEIASGSALVRGRRIWQDPQTFDPRAVVIAYLLLSAVLFLHDSLLQLAAASFVVAIVVAPFWPLIRQWVPVIRG